jgi:hypothetical protein
MRVVLSNVQAELSCTSTGARQAYAAMPGTTPDGLLGKVVGFISLMAVIPVFALSLPLCFMFGSPSCWGFGEKYRPSFAYVW